MKIILCIFLWYLILIDTVKAVDAYLNFTSGTSFDSEIKQAIVRQVSGTEYAFIYFQDGTIRKYSNQMVELSRFSIGNKTLSTF